MDRIKWKVCGLRDNIDEVYALGPDYIGFIFYDQSPRYVGDSFSVPYIRNRKVKKVGVFVNGSVELVLDKLESHDLDYVQLHGSESSEYCRKLSRKGVGVIKAFQVGEAFDFDNLKSYEEVVDFFLFDTKTRKHGGSGKTFDWSILRTYNLEKKYFLSGGVDLENINDLSEMDLSKLHGLDVNSRFEIIPGLKNVRMLEELKIRLKELDLIKSKSRLANHN